MVIGWTDPNTNPATASVKVYTVDGNGNPTTTEVTNVNSVSGRWAAMVAGQYALALKDASGNLSTKVVFTTATATQPIPCPTYTAQQLLEQATGQTVDVGDIVQLYPPTPTLNKTVQADGSLA